MSPEAIITNLKKIFGDVASPGQAFDAIMELRRDGVTWEDACLAISATGAPQPARRLRRLLAQEDEAMEFECPGCGVGRTNRDYCIVPTCPEYRPNPETERIEHEVTPSSFKNPRLGFGLHKGKTLREVAEINPAYLSWMAKNLNEPFWKEQAHLALLEITDSSIDQREDADLAS